MAGRACGVLAVTGAEPIACLLDTLDALEFIARHLHPPRLQELLAALGDRDAALRDAVWPEALREPLQRAATATLRACDGLRAAEDVRQVYRALRQIPRALEALFPLAGQLPASDRLFGTPGAGEVLHFHNETDQRGGFSAYLPGKRDPAHPSPLVMALHGGSGHGRLFLWSWLREVRGRGVVLVAPTATGDTWSLMEPQVDSAHLARVLDQVAQRWPLDRTHLLLTGMSDGGTFTLLSGLEEESPFTHLAPVAASFHPLLLTMAEPRRLTGLPVYLVHGALDWMFPVSMARTAYRALSAAGANVVYREIADLSHVYPRQEGSAILDWMLRPGAKVDASEAARSPPC
jgi:phospholipase/carboxylesterase